MIRHFCWTGWTPRSAEACVATARSVLCSVRARAFQCFSAVGWLKNLNISLQCAGNGIDWESGNLERLLPGAAQDIFPGDALAVECSSCSANFQAIVREVEITVQDLFGEHSRYRIQFADDAAKTRSFELDIAKVSTPLNIDAITNAQVGLTTLADLTSAQITAVTSTTASIDAGVPPQTGGAIEVRWSDQGWGQFNDENLAGRFTTQAFTLPRLTKVEDYFLRQYDASVPPRYSRHSAALHIDYPF